MNLTHSVDVMKQQRADGKNLKVMKTYINAYILYNNLKVMTTDYPYDFILIHLHTHTHTFSYRQQYGKLTASCFDVTQILINEPQTMLKA